MTYDLNSAHADFVKAGIATARDASNVFAGIKLPGDGLLPAAKYIERKGVVSFEPGRDEWGAKWMLAHRVFASGDELREHVSRMVAQFG